MVKTCRLLPSSCCTVALVRFSALTLLSGIFCWGASNPGPCTRFQDPPFFLLLLEFIVTYFSRSSFSDILLYLCASKERDPCCLCPTVPGAVSSVCFFSAFPHSPWYFLSSSLQFFQFSLSSPFSFEPIQKSSCFYYIFHL